MEASVIRERCSCGAEFETDEEKAVSMLREWRKVHAHQFEPGSLALLDSARSELAPDNVLPELHIGFRADPDDE